MLKWSFRSDLRIKSQLVAEDKEGLFVCAEEQTTIETTSKRETSDSGVWAQVKGG